LKAAARADLQHIAFLEQPAVLQKNGSKLVPPDFVKVIETVGHAVRPR
jgi:hypothetical protein